MRAFVVFLVVFGGMVLPSPAGAEGPRQSVPFMKAKTMFQINKSYDPRAAIAVDAVVVHRHSGDGNVPPQAIGSWREHGFTVGRMFFADSDGANQYWTGKWDGLAHPEDVERNEKGEVVKCAGVRPYMLPTEGWIRYLEDLTLKSIDAGAEAILSEEPLAHANTGYEEAFRQLWQERYGSPWQPESASPEARFLTCQLKNELYLKLEQRLAQTVKKRARELGRDIPFVLPIHSAYSNVASTLVAPLGTSGGVAGVDGYIGQIWTGPVNWALVHYDSPDKSFFDSAYCLYDYFVELACGTNRKLWLLVDPVEDNPQHKWSEFEEWYCRCVVAELLFPEVDSYEVMPWPERIFLPGYSTGGGTPAPERFRVIVLSATQVLQEVPLGGTWDPYGGKPQESSPAADVGVAVADTLMWEKEPSPSLQVIYGLLIPLVERGVRASACVLERIDDPRYLSRFKTIVLSYESFKPLDARPNTILAQWVKEGGSLLVVGPADDLGGAPFWWKKAGYPSPLHHLLGELGIRQIDADGDQPVGKGWVLRRTLSAREFGKPDVARDKYLPWVKLAVSKTAPGRELQTPGGFCLKRGPFVIVHAGHQPARLTGTFINLLDPRFPIVSNAEVPVGASGLFRDATGIMSGKGPLKGRPCVLHTTHRLMEEHSDGNRLRAVIRGPAETPAVVRLYIGDRKPTAITAHDASGGELQVQWTQDDRTILAQFPNDPVGATLELVVQ
jgi:hypothetical protein